MQPPPPPLPRVTAPKARKKKLSQGTMQLQWKGHVWVFVHVKSGFQLQGGGG